MNTKSRKFKVEPGFENLFTFSSREEKLEHRAQMISYRILSEVEKICLEKNIKMNDLSMMMKTSPSYMTQLFRGSRQVTTAFMARFEVVMKMCFEFSIHKEMELKEEISTTNITLGLIKKSQRQNPYAAHYLPHHIVSKIMDIKSDSFLYSEKCPATFSIFDYL